MDISSRRVDPEILDAIDPADPRAMRSRRDLQRVHRALRTVSILSQAVERIRLARPPRSILELGGGDATLLLRFARALQPRWQHVSLTVLDNQDVVRAETSAAYRSLGWDLQLVRQDALQWAVQPDSPHYDLCITNLFLHHFDGAALQSLLRATARHCDALIACEPRRSTLAMLGSKAIGLLGTNSITRQDAVTSVIAGFTGRELTRNWPADLQGWSCEEYSAFPFVHCFTAARSSDSSAAAPL
ncbi:MAG: methyltransferase domain-containing protein [Steroidobacteraceae bacterium]